MTFNQFKHNLKPANFFYICQAWFRRIFWSESKIRSWVMPKAEKCPPCFEQNACTECGCDAYMMMLSDKPCPKGNF